jgi:NADH dehydrogenase
VYVGDLARAVEVLSRNDPEVNRLVAGKYIEAGGPDGMQVLLVMISGLPFLAFTYREIMEIVLRYNHRRRPIISLPFQVGMLQGAILEKLPVNLFTVTRAQVCTEALMSILPGADV